MDTGTGMGMTWQYKQFLKNNNMTQRLKRWYSMGTEPQMKCPCFLDCNNEIWRQIERCSFAGVSEEWFAVIGC